MKQPKVTTEAMIAKAKALGVEVTVSTRPKGTGEIVPLPGVGTAGSAVLPEDDAS